MEKKLKLGPFGMNIELPGGQNMPVPVLNADIIGPLGNPESRKFAKELVERYNAYPNLLEMATRMFNIATHPKSKLADIRMIANETRSVLSGVATADEGPKPFTVMLVGVHRYTKMVMALSPEGAKVTAAKELIQEQGLEGYEVEDFFAAGTAVYAGHIENLLKS